MGTTQSSLTQFACQIRDVRYILENHNCDQCQQAAEKVGEVERTAIDIDLDQPVLLQVRVSVHYCDLCYDFGSDIRFDLYKEI